MHGRWGMGQMMFTKYIVLRAAQQRAEKANVTRPPTENGIAATALRLMICCTMTQGSSFLATLG
jgi:hypothetical protein